MESPQTSQGKDLPLKKNIYEKTLDFIEEVLVGFMPFSKNENNEVVKSENKITSDLNLVLQDKSIDIDLGLIFQNQAPSSSNFVTDIGIYRKNRYRSEGPFLWIEAKRLPTPNGGVTRDEREYVVVSDEKKPNGKRRYSGGGGIDRFKSGSHARHLNHSVMIGYIQSDEYQFWFNQVNSWIKQMINKSDLWNKSDLLQPCSQGECCRYISTHSRSLSEKPIILHHFWIYI